MIKAGDGTTWWPQFNAATVRTLHAWGLHVCAWQFVYGTHPVQEAAIGARAVRTGADCLVIDAESQYQGLYVQAQSYISALRAQIGARFPLRWPASRTSTITRSFPYSVFLGPNGAQYNVPQMYWRDIGTTVTSVYSHTYAFNQLYQRPIFPLGQVFDSPPASQINQFRAIAKYYGATGSAGGIGRAPAPRSSRRSGRRSGRSSASCHSGRWRASAAAPRATSSSGRRSISSRPGSDSRSTATSASRRGAPCRGSSRLTGCPPTA